MRISMDVKNRKRLHWAMYGLYYPAVLGTVVVVTLQHSAAGLVHGPALAIAITAAAFFSLSFASAMGLEEDYGAAAFGLDIAEIVGMFACFAYLNLIDFPETGHLPWWVFFSPRLAYGIVLAIVLLQVGWRKVMGLHPDSFLDLKMSLVVLLVIGIVVGANYLWLHWVITAAFALLAWLYVSHNPYQKDHPVRRWFCIPEPDSSATNSPRTSTALPKAGVEQSGTTELPSAPRHDPQSEP